MGKPPTLYSFPTNDGLTAALRQYVVHKQNAALERHNVFRVAVSGGSLPKSLAQALLAPSSSASDSIDFSKWQIFFADERVVKLNHKDSNYKALKDELLDKIPKDKLGFPRVFPIDESNPMTKSELRESTATIAEDYKSTLLSVFAARDSVKLPLFDLILLGCGPDGHTCSLFPGEPALKNTEDWVIPVHTEAKPPPWRITLSLPVVTHAVAVAFVATGEGKKDILKKIFETEEGSTLPCGLVNERSEDSVAWFTDSAAADGVSFPKKSSL